jgi:TonB-linked SusC/RagA family outer membrane protein
MINFNSCECKVNSEGASGWFNLFILQCVLVLGLCGNIQAEEMQQPQQSESITISGKVLAKADKKALPGVSVIVKGTTKGTVTSVSGEFSLMVERGVTLVFSFIGFQPVEVLIGNQTSLLVELVEDVQELNEVVVVSTGYQDVDKRLFTGALSSLSAKELKTEGTIDVSRMLQGKAAGVSVQNVSGTFGAAPKIRVRGSTSITGDNKPLWVVDGVVLEDVVNVSSDQLTTGDPATLIGSSVAGLNSDDIESINILKDASATALYGARAKDGVIVIRTKKGREGKPMVSYTGNFSSYLRPTYNDYNILNSVDQMSVYSEMERKGLLNHADVSRYPHGGVYLKMYDLINSNQLENTTAAKRAYLQRYARSNTDWFKVLFQNSFVQEHSLGITSGSESSQVYFSTSYYNDNGWTIADNVKRYTANAKATFKLSDRVDVGFTATGAVRDQRVPGTVSRQTNVVEGSFSRDFDINPFSYALNTSRVLTPYDANGKLEYFTRNFAPFNILNEVAKNYIDLNQLDFKGQADIGFKVTKEIKYDFIGAIRRVKTLTEHNVEEGSNMAEAYRANGSIVVRQGNKFLYYNPDFPNADPVVVLPEGGFYNRTDDEMKSYYVKNQLSWNHAFTQVINTNFIIGQEIRQVDRQNSFNNGFGYQFSKGGVPFTDYRMIKQMLEGNFSYFGMGNYFDRYASFYAGNTLSYREKYVLNSTLRYDGSNRLGESPSARWLPTWNVSAAWNLDTEPFIQQIKAIDYLTLRAGYGLTANAGNATNSSAVFRSGITPRPYFDETETHIIIEGLENSDLTWEKQYETNIGINVGLFNKLNVTLDVYTRNHFDLISIIKTSGIGGEAYKAVNYADMKSKGVDLSIGATVMERNRWSWQTNFVYSRNTSRITNLKNEPRISDLVFPDGGAREGYPVRGLFSIQFKGLDPNTGVPLFLNQDGEISPDVFMQSLSVEHLKYEGSVDPTYSGGLSNTFKYKDFNLNVFLSYQGGNKVRLNPAFRSSYTDLDAMPREFLDRWVLPGDEKYTNIPSIADMITLSQLGATYPYNNYNYSSARVVDGSFVRLRSVSLGYNLPVRYFKYFGVKSSSITLTGTNLLLLYADKKLYGQDPEFVSSGGVAMPVAKQITATVKLTF